MLISILVVEFYFLFHVCVLLPHPIFVSVCTIESVLSSYDKDIGHLHCSAMLMATEL